MPITYVTTTILYYKITGKKPEKHNIMKAYHISKMVTPVKFVFVNIDNIHLDNIQQ